MSSPETASSATDVFATPSCRSKTRSLSITRGSCLHWNRQQLNSECSNRRRSPAWSSLHLTKNKAHDRAAVRPVMRCVYPDGAGWNPPAPTRPSTRIWAAFEASAEDERKSRIKAGVAGDPRGKHFCPQCGQLRGLLRCPEIGSKTEKYYHFCGRYPRTLTATTKNQGSPPERSLF